MCPIGVCGRGIFARTLEHGTSRMDMMLRIADMRGLAGWPERCEILVKAMGRTTESCPHHRQER